MTAAQVGTSAAEVLVAGDGPVRVVTLDRPGVRNAIDMPLRIALAEPWLRRSKTPSGWRPAHRWRSA